MANSKSSRRAIIVTAIRPEYQAVRHHLTELEEIRHPQGTVYERGKFIGNDGNTWAVCLLEIGASNPQAALETERAISFFDPSVAFFVGVAGGVKDVRLCDVVAATKVYGYESGKSEKTFKPRPCVGEGSYSLVQRARAEARKEGWLKRVSNLPDNIHPQVQVAPIAAGEKVVASSRSDTRKFLLTNYGDAVAVEMEGRGFLQAVHANQTVSALVIRGVSDLLSGKSKSDKAGYQIIAARAASAFAFEVLANLDSSAPQEIQQETVTYTLVLRANIEQINLATVQAIIADLQPLAKDTRLRITRITEGPEGD